MLFLYSVTKEREIVPEEMMKAIVSELAVPRISIQKKIFHQCIYKMVISWSEKLEFGESCVWRRLAMLCPTGRSKIWLELFAKHLHSRN